MAIKTQETLLVETVIQRETEIDMEIEVAIGTETKTMIATEIAEGEMIVAEVEMNSEIEKEEIQEDERKQDLVVHLLGLMHRDQMVQVASLPDQTDHTTSIMVHLDLVVSILVDLQGQVVSILMDQEALGNAHQVLATSTKDQMVLEILARDQMAQGTSEDLVTLVQEDLKECMADHQV